MPTVSVNLNENIKKCDVASDDTIYNQLEKNSIVLPHGCLAGSCGTCKIEIISGAENLKPPSAIEKNTLDSIYQNYPSAQGKTLRLSCRAKALGDVTIKPFTGKAV
jgi:ferredoxin